MPDVQKLGRVNKKIVQFLREFNRPLSVDEIRNHFQVPAHDKDRGKYSRFVSRLALLKRRGYLNNPSYGYWVALNGNKKRTEPEDRHEVLLPTVIKTRTNSNVIKKLKELRDHLYLLLETQSDPTQNIPEMDVLREIQKRGRAQIHFIQSNKIGVKLTINCLKSLDDIIETLIKEGTE